MKRVVVTGMSAATPVGLTWETVSPKLLNLETGVRTLSEWDKFKDLNTRLAAPVTDFKKPPHYTRKMTRSMSRVSEMSAFVTERALEQAGLLGDPSITSGDMGVAYGSSSGSLAAILDFGSMLLNHEAGTLNANSYIKMMAHTAPVNLSVFFGLKGRLYTTSSACTSGSQGIGSAYEAIKYGHQVSMVAGGAEELSPAQAAVFDTLYATSTKNDTPSSSPRPFDVDRDGLVIGEAAGTLILEELEHAQARGATILAELVGYGTNCDGSHVVQPSKETMRKAMELALQDAQLHADAIGYTSAHGTATAQGDIAESLATEEVFGSRMPISSFKSFTGHTLGGCGAIEAWLAIEMMNAGWFHATANLNNVDPACGELDFIQNEARYIDCEYVMSNNFAFGGINTSLIFKRWT